MKNPEKIKKMFNEIAVKYDFMNKIISLGLHKYVKYLSIKRLKITQNAKVLDLCTGTGDIAGFIKKIQPTAEITAVDFSENMLNIARKKVENVNFIQADCTELPLDNDSFDICTISFGLRNIENRTKAVSEIYRVLKKKGIFMHLDFGRSNFLFENLFNLIIPKLVKIFYKNAIPYEYLVKSKQTFPAPKELISEFEKSGFLLIKKSDFLFGIISSQIFSK